MFVYFSLKVLHFWWSSWEGWECLLTGSGRNLVRTCKPLIWLVRGTSTFLIRKIKIRNSCLKYSFYLCHSTASRFIHLLFYGLHCRFNSKIIYKGNNVIKNIKCPIVFQFQSSWTRTLGFGQPNFYVLLVWRTSGWEKFSRGAKKVIFKACHSGKLTLAYTSPNVISTSSKNVLMSRIDFTVLL